MIRFVKKEDIPCVLEMMELVKDDFAGYKEKEFLDALEKSIVNKESIVDERDNKIAGMVSFSCEEKELTFLAVHPQYRRLGIAKEMITKMKESFHKGDVIHVITFREGDPKGVGAITCYLSCGFTADEELEVFNYPCQKFILRIE